MKSNEDSEHGDQEIEDLEVEDTPQQQYQFSHSRCSSQACCTCSFKFSNYSCNICGIIMQKLPLKMLYCIDCANSRALCPYTFCQQK